MSTLLWKKVIAEHLYTLADVIPPPLAIDGGSPIPLLSGQRMDAASLMNDRLEEYVTKASEIPEFSQLVKTLQSHLVENDIPQ